MTSDADVLTLVREAESLIERAARKERDAALLQQQAVVLINDASALRSRAAAITTQLGIAPQ